MEAHDHILEGIVSHGAYRGLRKRNRSICQLRKMKKLHYLKDVDADHYQRATIWKRVQNKQTDPSPVEEDNEKRDESVKTMKRRAYALVPG